MAKKTIAISSVQTALTLFYTKTEIDTNDIKKLFNITSSNVVCRLRKSAKEEMEKSDIQCWNANCVDTECAFRAWKIDVAKLERMHTKLKKLELVCDEQ